MFLSSDSTGRFGENRWVSSHSTPLWRNFNMRQRIQQQQSHDKSLHHPQSSSLPNENRSIMKWSTSDTTNTNRSILRKCESIDVDIDMSSAECSDLGSSSCQMGNGSHQQCICNRPTCVLICVLCGFMWTGRLQLQCGVHPNVEHLMDHKACPARCGSTDIKECAAPVDSTSLQPACFQYQTQFGHR